MTKDKILYFRSDATTKKNSISYITDIRIGGIPSEFFIRYWDLCFHEFRYTYSLCGQPQYRGHR